MTLGAPNLRVADLSVRYGLRTVLSRLDLEVHPSEVVALVGPNGSGKTTLIRSVLGLVPPVAGRIELLGRSTGTLTVRERAQRVAWVPQEESPRDDVRLYDYVLYGRYAHQGPWQAGGPSDRAAALRALADVDLADRAEEGILTLSGGERQRAILARALAQSTPLLLLDEPTAHLDIAHQLFLFDRVRTLARSRGTAVLAALHDLNLASRFADRLVVLSRGRRVADGPPSEVLSEDLIARVWGIAVDLERDRRTGIPYLVPHQMSLSSPRTRASPFVGPVHVVGGGGAAAPILRGLSEEGYRVTAGALHLLDSDAEVAEALGIPSAVESPFAALGPEARAAHLRLLSAARVIVVSPFAVGPSNLANLADVAPFVGRVPVLLVRDPPIGGRDFTGGQATEIYGHMRSAGAVEVAAPAAVLAAVRDLFAGSSADAGPASPRPGGDPERANVERGRGPDRERRE